MEGRGTPYLGASIWNLRRARRNPIAFLTTLTASGPVAEFWIAGQQAFLLSDAADVHDVLVTHATAFAKPSALRRAGRLLGNGLLTADGAAHVARRRLAQPAFSRHHIDRYARTVVEQATATARAWRDGDTIDLSAAMGTLTLCIAGRALFGVDLAPDADAIRTDVAEASDAQDALVSLLAPGRQLAPARLRLRALVARLVDERLRALTRTAHSAAEDDVLTTLCRAHDRDDAAALEQLHDDVLTLLLAGHDTIATCMVSTWSLLAQHPRAQAKMHAELDALGSPAVPTDVAGLPYTTAVVTESLRLQPPAWIIARQARTDHTLGSRRLPAGSLVVMSPYLMHRDRRYFDDPVAFLPDRWLPEPSGRSRPGYLPFGAGPRACIGESFAMMEGVLLLATLGREWRLASAGSEPVAYDVRITLRPAGAVPVRLERRHDADHNIPS